MPWDQRGIRRISEKETAIDGKIYKGGMTMTNREVYERDCEELEQYREIGTVEECREAVKKWKNGYKTRTRRGARICVDIGKIIALHNAGWPAPKIADELGVSKRTVYRYLPSRE